MGLLLVAAIAGAGCTSTANPTVHQGEHTGGSGGSGGTGSGGSGGSGGTGGTQVVKDPNAGAHLLFYDQSHGFSGAVLSVGADQGGNIYAASKTYLNVLRPGQAAWDHLSSKDGLLNYPVMSVAGGNPDEVYVGYEGQFPDNNYFDDPPAVAKSGDADRLRFRADGTFDRLHYDIYSPPSKDYPQGRELLRTVYRIIPILSGPYAGDVWFGCNHGMAQWNQTWHTIAEHQHMGIWRDGNWWTGDHRGLAITKEGNVWIAGAHLTGLIHYADEGGQFWAKVDPSIDVWPDNVSKLPRGDDFTNALAVTDDGSLWIGSMGNGLALRLPDGTMAYWDTQNGLPDNRVYDLALDPDGSLWIATDASLVRMQGGRIVHGLDWGDGLPGSVYSVLVDTSTTPRRVLVGTSSGVGVYDGP